MTIYTFDGTMDDLLTAVFDAFSLKEQPEELLAEGDALPLFCDHTYHVYISSFGKELYFVKCVIYSLI